MTFSGAYAQSNQQPVLYITERCVFRLTQQGMTLTEIAPGIDLEQDILAQMDFKPVIASDLKSMDARIFRSEPMNLAPDLLSLKLEDRLTFDAQENIFFVNFEGYAVKTRQEITNIQQAVENVVKPLSQRVHTIVNYDNFSILPELVDEYTEMVKYLMDNFYSGVTRYTTSAFLRMKLGDALKKRSVAPHIYENSEEASQALKKL